MMPTKAQIAALSILAGGPLDEMGVTVTGLRRDMLRRIADAGLAKWCPAAKPYPAWRITAAGRKALHDAP